MAHSGHTTGFFSIPEAGFVNTNPAEVRRRYACIFGHLSDQLHQRRFARLHVLW